MWRWGHIWGGDAVYNFCSSLVLNRSHDLHTAHAAVSVMRCLRMSLSLCHCACISEQQRVFWTSLSETQICEKPEVVLYMILYGLMHLLITSAVECVVNIILISMLHGEHIVVAWPESEEHRQWWMIQHWNHTKSVTWKTSPATFALQKQLTFRKVCHIYAYFSRSGYTVDTESAGTYELKSNIYIRNWSHPHIRIGMGSCRVHVHWESRSRRLS